MADKKGILSFLKLEGAVDHLLGMVESRIQIAKIEAKEEVAEILAEALVRLSLALFAFIFFLFLNVALALWLGSLLQQEFVGFLIVAGFHILMFLILLLVKDKIGLKEMIQARLNKAFKTKKR